jgi:hypothetical protein
MLILKHLTIQSLLKKTLVNTIQETIEITISTNSTDRDIANTLLHEIVHASVWYGGLKDDGAALEDDKHEEHVVNVLTNQLCQIFRDNPKILTIIKKGLTGKNGRAKKGDQVMATPEKILERYTFHKNRK